MSFLKSVYCNLNLMGILIVCLSSSASLAVPSASKDQKLLFEDKSITEKYADHVLAHMKTVVKDAENLKAKIATFTKDPSEQTHIAAKAAWKKARDSYSESENFRFYGGPIDDPESGVEGFVNAWPIDESYIDYSKDNANSGIINDPKKFPKINKELLLSLNEKDGEKNISTGYHAIEFLLWGQDPDLIGAGNREFADYIPGKGKNAERRALYLNTLADLLVEHLKKVEQKWETSYRATFLALPAHDAATKILTGMTSLLADELAGERMMVALEKQDPENEQDCFSDYSVEDLMSNLRGVESTYEKSGLKAYFTKHQAKLALKIQDHFKGAAKALESIPRPFDKTISPSGSAAAKKKVQVAIDKVQHLAKEIAVAALKEGIELNIETK